MTFFGFYKCKIPNGITTIPSDLDTHSLLDLGKISNQETIRNFYQ